MGKNSDKATRVAARFYKLTGDDLILTLQTSITARNDAVRAVQAGEPATLLAVLREALAIFAARTEGG